MPNRLSLSTQAVLDAILEISPAPADEIAAAALRAAADQVVPPALEEEFYERNHSLHLNKMVEIRQKLIAIADELETNY